MGACCAIGDVHGQSNQKNGIQKKSSVSNHKPVASNEIDTAKTLPFSRMISDFTDMIDIDHVAGDDASGDDDDIGASANDSSQALKKHMPPLPGQTFLNGQPWEISWDLKEDLSTLESAFGPDKFKPILNQSWLSVTGRDDLKRNEDEDDGSISILQWNMLSDSLGGGYTLTDTQKTFVNVDKTSLRWTYRGLRLLEVMTKFNTDLIAVEECDQFEFIQKFLNLHGYTALYQPKSKSPTRHIANEICKERGFESFECNPDGLMLAFKRDRFELIGEPARIADGENKEKCVALAIRLREISNQRQFVFACTHLKSTKTIIGERIRKSQIKSMWNDLLPKTGVLNDLHSNLTKPLPIIFCADLNATPVKNKKGYGPKAYTTMTGEVGFQSIYAHVNNGQEPAFTTLKQREAGVDKHTIDYIFVKNMPVSSFQVTHTLSIPPDCPESVIPSWSYPSDHFCIGAKIVF